MYSPSPNALAGAAVAFDVWRLLVGRDVDGVALTRLAEVERAGRQAGMVLHRNEEQQRPSVCGAAGSTCGVDFVH